MEIRKTRIAPTPSGYLHIGNIVNFLITAALARQSGAGILLRIDDLDRERVRPEYVQDVFDTLRFLGIPWDEGPEDPADFEANWSQASRLPLYREAFEKLKEKKLVFACNCSRKQVALAGTKGKYPGTCRSEAVPDEEVVCNWRFHVNAASEVHQQFLDGKQSLLRLPSRMQDFVVWKKDGFPAYQLASLIDDVHFGIDLIVRGNDLLGSTAAQLLLANALGQTSFSKTRFLHHELIYAKGRKKLSKSAGSTSIHYMRSKNLRMEKVYRHVSDLLGLEKVVTGFGEFLEEFSCTRH
jgi:glutamyl/glutaminyl-tRNA synthetase